MLAETLINPALPAAYVSENVVKVLALMEAANLSQLALVDDDKELQGLVARADLERTDVQGTLADVRPSRPAAGSFVYASQHAYDALSLLIYSGNYIVPVLNAEDAYIGSIGREEALLFLGNMLTLKEPGGILVLKVERNNYQLREIASIVESNDARILSLYLSSVTGSTSMHVTLKVNVSELSQIVMGFERYGYTLAYTFFDTKQMDDNKDRYDLLMRFINT